MSKVCVKCRTDWPLRDYYLNNQMPDGHVNVCKYCKRSYDRNRKYGLYDEVGRLMRSWRRAA